MTENSNRYPKSLFFGEKEIALRYMTSADQAAVVEFAKSFPDHDLLYLNRDITNPKVVSAWAKANEAGSIHTILAFDGDELVGCSALIRDPLSWSPHLGEIRVQVAPSVRRIGLGRILIQECFVMALADNLKKLMAQMTVDQKGAIAIFEELGFRGEALLKDHVQDSNGDTHDIVILSCDVERVHAQLAAYGIDAVV